MNQRMRIFFFIVCICFIFFVLATDSACTQSYRTTYWLNGGLGASSLGSLGGSTNFSVRFNRVLISLRGTANSENAELFGGGDEFFDSALLLGLARGRRNKFASIAMGIARVTGNHYVGKPGLFSDGKRVDITPVIGLPLEVQLFLRPSRFFGLGAYIYGNLNSEQSFGGITFCLQLGKLR